MDENLLFIYGTLLKDLNNNLANYLYKNSNIIGKGYFCGELYDLGNYPGAIFNPDSKNKVYGVILELNDNSKLFPILDNYEVAEASTEDSLFIRQKIEVHFNKSTILCFVYLFNKSTKGLPLISSGDYQAYLKNKSS